VKGIEKITSVRLAEILTERSIVSSEVITDALYAQDRNGDPFIQVLISGGHITEWDLAKLVTENFNLPFLMAGNYQISDEAKKRFPKDLLYKHTMVPLDVFGDIVCIAMPVMLSFEEMNKIQKEHNCDLFPYVGLVSENKKVLTEMHRDYPQWIEQEQKRREDESKKRQGSSSKSPGDWMSIFDAGDQAIQEMKKKPDPTPAVGPVVGPKAVASDKPTPSTLRSNMPNPPPPPPPKK
jgi:Type II secretion system (T2SS), protein E, N-terminal domain